MSHATKPDVSHKLTETLSKCRISFFKLKPYQKLVVGVGALALISAAGVGVVYGLNPRAASSTVTCVQETFNKGTESPSKQDVSSADNSNKDSSGQSSKDSLKSSTATGDVVSDTQASDSKKANANNEPSGSSDTTSAEDAKTDSGNSKASNSGSQPAKEKKPVYRTETIHETQPVYEKQWVPNIVEVFDYRQEKYVINNTGEVLYDLGSLEARLRELAKARTPGGGYYDDSYDVYKKEDHGYYEDVQVGTKQVAVGTREVLDHWE